MTAQKTLDVFVRDADGSFSCAYGPYSLHTAFQPIFQTGPDGSAIGGYHGLVRIERQGDGYAPAEFLNTIDPRDLAHVDSQVAALHIRNARIFAETGATIHLPRNPRHFHTLQDMKADAERLRAAADAAGISPRRIVCELQLRDFEDLERSGLFAGHLRRAGMLVGIDGYSGEERDIARVRAIRPTYVRFDTQWLFGFLGNTAGVALLRVVIRQFREQNITIIASGLEDDEHVDLLERIGMPRIQGHALARPERAPETFADQHLQVQSPALLHRERAEAVQHARPAPVALPIAAGERRAPLRRAQPAFGRRGLS